jgi:PIN domain nuclease of toxin-antitoxin system
MNEFLVDTHVLLWYIQGNTRLSAKTITLINNPQNVIYVSKVSLWEISLKMSIGKLTLSIPFEDLAQFLADKNFIVLDFDFTDLSILKSLPFHHTDPFDRLIISQAINNDLCLISDDSKFGAYSVHLVEA